MKTIATTVVFAFLFCMSHSSILAQYKVKNIVGGCKPNLKPYIYDSYAITDLEFNDQPKKIEVQFTAFAHQKYKLVFCSSGFEENLKVNIYDKNSKVKNRTQVYDNENGIDNLFWSFEPKKTGNYFIEYEVPPAIDSKPKKGCVVLLVGVEIGQASR